MRCKRCPSGNRNSRWENSCSGDKLAELSFTAHWSCKLELRAVNTYQTLLSLLRKLISEKRLGRQKWANLELILTGLSQELAKKESGYRIECGMIKEHSCWYFTSKTISKQACKLSGCNWVQSDWHQRRVCCYQCTKEFRTARDDNRRDWELHTWFTGIRIKILARKAWQSKSWQSRSCLVKRQSENGLRLIN